MNQAEAAAKPHLIEVKVAELHQLFNSMDPSPFHERDLDHDAESFIVSWAQECPRHTPIRIVVHVTRAPETVANPQELVSESLRHYFLYQADMRWRQFKELMREGRTSLIIGLLFLAFCNLAAPLVFQGTTHWKIFLREGLAIGGWVAMWRPLEIYLYLWWPILRMKRLHEKLACAEVEIKTAK